MANIIKIKRGLSSDLSKANLQEGEIAFTTDTKKLYVSTTAAPINENTTYKLTKSGSTITLTGSDGTTTSVTDSNTTYTHPTSAGNKHIPSGGEAGQILRWSAAGTAVWGADNNTTYSNASTSVAGLMSAADKTKLDGIASGANKYSLPAATTSALGGVIVGSNITVSSGTISLTKSNVTTALGYTPPTTNTTYSVVSTTADGLCPKRGGTTTKFLRDDGTWATPPDTNTTYSAATTSAAGLMSAADKTKLDGIATGANNYTYTLPTASSTLGGVKTTSTVTSTSGLTACPIISGVVYYKDTNTTYTHPTTSGNKHIPSGGSSGQILRWSADGTAVWGADNNTTYSAATTSANGLMTSAMVTKLNGIATGAQVNNLVVSTSTPTASTAEAWINPNGQTTITALQNRIAVLEDDTGWQNLSLASGVSAVRARIRRKCGIVFLEIINLTGWTTQTAFTTIPAGFRPDTASVNNTYRWAAPTTGANWTRPEFKADGGLCIFTTTTTAGAWTDVIVSYIPVGY